MWDLQQARAIERFHVTWRKSVRRLWNIPSWSRTNILHHLVNKPTFLEQLHKRFMMLFKGTQQSDNHVVHHLVQLSVQEPKGIIGNNLDICRAGNTTADDGAEKAAMVKELTKCLENSMTLSNFNNDEIRTLINLIATT